MPSDHPVLEQIAPTPIPLLALVIVAIVVGALLPPLIGFPPYGEQAMLRQIDQQNSAECAKLGFATASEQFSSCKIDLAALRRSHAELLDAYAWR